MFIEYKCGNGMPWQADDHHVATWEDRCKDDPELPKEKWCTHCQEDGPEQTRCESGYLDYKSIYTTGRNYGLFSRLASVRGDGPREPLGLPDDVSGAIQAASDKWDSDGHSHSYMMLDEFKKVIFNEMKFEPSDSDDAFLEKKYKDYSDYPDDYTTIINYAEKLKELKSMDKQILGSDTSSEVQIRLVFWFDN